MSDHDNVLQEIVEQQEAWEANKFQKNHEYIDSLTENDVKDILKKLTQSIECCLNNTFSDETTFLIWDLLGHIYKDTVPFLPPCQCLKRMFNYNAKKRFQMLLETQNGQAEWESTKSDAIELLRSIGSIYQNSSLLNSINKFSAVKFRDKVEEQLNILNDN